MDEVEPGGLAASTKASTRVPGASTSCAVARQKRLGRLTVDGHYADVVIFDFYSNNIALASR